MVNQCKVNGGSATLEAARAPEGRRWLGSQKHEDSPRSAHSDQARPVCGGTGAELAWCLTLLLLHKAKKLSASPKSFSSLTSCSRHALTSRTVLTERGASVGSEPRRRWSIEQWLPPRGSSGNPSRDGVRRGTGDDGGGPLLGAPGALAGPVAHSHSR